MLLSVFGPVLTGYLTVSGRSHEVWQLTLKILLYSAIMGVSFVSIFGAAGWLAALVFSQILVVLPSGFKHWKREHGK